MDKRQIVKCEPNLKVFQSSQRIGVLKIYKLHTLFTYRNNGSI